MEVITTLIGSCFITLRKIMFSPKKGCLNPIWTRYLGIGEKHHTKIVCRSPCIAIDLLEIFDLDFETTFMIENYKTYTYLYWVPWCTKPRSR